MIGCMHQPISVLHHSGISINCALHYQQNSDRIRKMRAVVYYHTTADIIANLPYWSREDEKYGKQITWLWLYQVSMNDETYPKLRQCITTLQLSLHVFISSASYKSKQNHIDYCILIWTHDNGFMLYHVINIKDFM